MALSVFFIMCTQNSKYRTDASSCRQEGLNQLFHVEIGGVKTRLSGLNQLFHVRIGGVKTDNQGLNQLFHVEI